MASSVPVITTGVGGIKDLLGDFDINQNDNKSFKPCQRGILCPSGNPVAFAEGIMHMLNHSYKKGSPKVLKARDFVLKNYSDERLVRNIENLYLELMSK